MQNMVMLCKVDSLVVNVIFHTSSKLYANVTSSKKCQVIKNWQFDMPGVIGMGVTQRPEELVQSSTVKNVGNRIQPMCFIGQILKTSTEQFLFRNRRSNAIRKSLRYPNLRKGLLSKYKHYSLISKLIQNIFYTLHITTVKIIRTYYIKRCWISIYLECQTKNKKVLIMALIYKNMVYSHCVEVHSIVFPIIDFHTQFL